MSNNAQTEKEGLAELNKNNFENKAIAHGVETHTLILLYNQLSKSQTKETEKTLKEQIAVSLQPKTGSMSEYSKESVLRITKEFLENFRIPEIENNGD